MFDDYLKYLGSADQLEDFVDLKIFGLTSEEIEGYFSYFENKERASNERNKFPGK